MWLLDVDTKELKSFEGDQIPKYAILSHRWETEEVLFKDMRKQRGDGKLGMKKITACCKQASSEGFQYVWIDTCCIDKSSSAELSEAINSMYNWYEMSEKCFAYLSDISNGDNLTKSVWFERGWTLQELLAPTMVVFFDSDWNGIGSKRDHAQSIEKRTGIPLEALEMFRPDDYCIAQKMSWANGRTTTRIEDRAYSLFGLFSINMPLLYGEGKKAFWRLQYELMREYNDTSIFLSVTSEPVPFGMLAASPDDFQRTHLDMNPNMFKMNFILSKEGVSGKFRLYHWTLDVYALMLDSEPESAVAKLHGFVPIRWNFAARQFQRVYLESLHAFLGVLKPDTANFVGEHNITVGRLPRERFSIGFLDRNRLKYYFGWPKYATGFSTSLFCIPGHFSRKTHHGPCVEPTMQQNLEEWVRSDIVTILPADYAKSYDGHCLCIGGAGQSISPKDWLDTQPTLVVHFGRDFWGEFTVFVSWLLNDSDSSPVSSTNGGRPCHLSGYCWYAASETRMPEIMCLAESPPKFPAIWAKPNGNASYMRYRYTISDWIYVYFVQTHRQVFIFIVFWFPTPDQEPSAGWKVWAIWRA